MRIWALPRRCGILRGMDDQERARGLTGSGIGFLDRFERDRRARVGAVAEGDQDDGPTADVFIRGVDLPWAQVVSLALKATVALAIVYIPIVIVVALLIR